MFEWVKRLFRKKPEFDMSLLIVCETIKPARTKGGKFAKGNTIWKDTPRDYHGRFVRMPK